MCVMKDSVTFSMTNGHKTEYNMLDYGHLFTEKHALLTCLLVKLRKHCHIWDVFIFSIYKCYNFLYFKVVGWNCCCFHITEIENIPCPVHLLVMICLSKLVNIYVCNKGQVLCGFRNICFKTGSSSQGCCVP